MAGTRHKAVKQRGRLGKYGPPVAAVFALAVVGTFGVRATMGDDTTPSESTQATTSTTRSEDRGDQRATRSGEREELSKDKKKSLTQGSQAPRSGGSADGGNSDPVDARQKKNNDRSENNRDEDKESEDPVRTGTRFATTELNVRSGPGEEHDIVDTLETGDKVGITDTTEGDWTQILHDGEPQWVTSEYLAKKKPDDAESDSGALSDAPCDTGSEVESGLTSDAIAVHRAVCAEFPEVTSYGGIRPGDDGEHGTGQAIDIMITGSTGDQIAEFVQANAGDLGVSEIIWEQQIWSVERGSEGWRPMEDRGSDTANHFDHVHVTVYGDSAS